MCFFVGQIMIFKNDVQILVFEWNYRVMCIEKCIVFGGKFEFGDIVLFVSLDDFIVQCMCVYFSCYISCEGEWWNVWYVIICIN